ncbi:MAG TPA: hypothetical protein VJJ83_01620, partial [Candidatus Babeliales bacterium]|nr:hypothetical protein [Candidatus Babeliales bacterium]
ARRTSATVAANQVPLLSAPLSVSTDQFKPRSASAPAIIVPNLAHARRLVGAAAPLAAGTPVVTASTVSEMVTHTTARGSSTPTPYSPSVTPPASPPASPTITNRFYDPLANATRTQLTSPVSDVSTDSDGSFITATPPLPTTVAPTAASSLTRQLVNQPARNRYLSRDAGLTGYLKQYDHDERPAEYRLTVDTAHSSGPPELHPGTILHALYQERQTARITPS